MAPNITSPTDPNATSDSPLRVSLDQAPPSPPPVQPSRSAVSAFPTDDDGELSPAASPHVMALQGIGALDRAVKLFAAVIGDLPMLMPLVAPLTELSKAMAAAVPQAIQQAVAPNPLLDLQQMPPMGMAPGMGMGMPPGPPGPPGLGPGAAPPPMPPPPPR